MKPIFANLKISRPLCLFKSSKFYEEKFDIIIANWYGRKSTNRHKDDHTIIYFEEYHFRVHIAKFKFSWKYIHIYIRNLQITCFKMINNLFIL